MGQALSRPERLRRRPEFLKVQQHGTRSRGQFLTLFLLPNRLDVSRLGIIASRRLGGATRRNRAKRVVREIFRRNKGGRRLDVVVMPRPGFSDASVATLEHDFRHVLRRYERTGR